MQFPAKKITGCGKTTPAAGGNILRRANFPSARHVRFRLGPPEIRHHHEADVGEIGGGNFLGPVLNHADTHLHVGLPGAKPYLADQHVLQLALGGTSHGERLRRGVGGHRRELHRPLAVSTGDGGIILTGEGHGNFRPGRIPAPHRIGLILLQHHVVAKDGGKFQFRAQIEAKREDEHEQQKVFFHGHD